MTAPDPHLGEIEARLTAASDGPWEFVGNDIDQCSPGYGSILETTVECSSYCYGGSARLAISAPNRAFIESAPSDVAYLLAELREARDALARVEEWIAKFEANRSSDIAKRQNMQFDLGYSAGRRSAGAILREAVTAAMGGGE